MISQVGPALKPRFARLFVRAIIIVLIVLLVAQGDYHNAREAARAEESAPDPVSALKAGFASFPLSFITNAGQVAPDVRFEVRGMGGNLYFSPGEVTLIFPGADAGTLNSVRLHHIGANPTPALTGADLQPGIVNYMLGNDPARWFTKIPTYAGVFYEELYPGITLHYDGTTGLLKGTYLVAPGANPDQIRWQYDGVQRAEFDAATQDLRLYLTDEAKAPYLTEFAPHAWQEINNTQAPVDVRYTLFDDQSIGLTLGEYDPTLPLFLDPLLLYSSYFGGSGADIGYGIAADNEGNVYLTGRTTSGNFPREKPYQFDNAGGADLFITKFNSSTQDLVYSTFLGGSIDDIGNDIAIDAAGNAYITGETASNDFPMPVPTAYETTLQGGSDAFVVKLNPTGDAIVYSTYLGGSGSDRAYGLAVNAAGNVYVTGETSSANFPITAGKTLPNMGSYLGFGDAFVTKLLADGSDLVFSTFLGGTAIDVGGDITVDASNNAYIVGRTESINFPTFSASQSNYGGSGDAFITKITGGSAPSYIYSTYMGGNAQDSAVGVAEGSDGIVYITGETQSSNIPLIGALPPEQGGSYNGGRDAFVGAYSSTGTKVYFTYLGGSNLDKGAGIALDTSGDIYVVGETQSGADLDPTRNFPHINGFQTGFGGISDAFVTKIVADTSTIEYSSFLGGDGSDQGLAVAVIGGGTLYMTGNTVSENNFPIAGKAFQRGGNMDAFIIRIGANQADLSITKIDDPSTVAVGQNLKYTITVRNNGPDSTIATVTDDLKKAWPQVQYFDFVSATPEQGSCTYDVVTLKVTCQLGEMTAGQEVEIELIVNVTTRPNGGAASNTVSVSGSELDPNDDVNQGTQNSYSQTTPVIFSADLEVTKLSSRYRVRLDETVVFSISIHNLGPGTATGVELTDVLPADLIIEQVTPPAGTTYDPLTGLWTVGTILPNTPPTTLVIAARVKDNLEIGAVITNSANITKSPVSDPDPTNNSSTVQLLIVTEVPEPGCHPSPTNPNEIICLFG